MRRKLSMLAVAMLVVATSAFAADLAPHHLPLTVRRHTARGRQPGDMLAVDLTPDALRPARCVALEERLLVERLPEPVDPSPTERHVERLRGRDRRDGRPLLRAGA